MKKSVFGLIVLIFLAVTAIPVFAQDKDPVILNVAGEEISRSEFLNVYMKNNVNSEVLDRKSLEEYMELYINFRLKVKEAEALGLDTVRSFKEELAGYRKQLAQPYLIDEEMNKSLLQEAYDRKKTD
ncbi:MAG TPA: peptidylprolyl isomerase, partial [Lentimicrobium sp.]|nr:peptidylprolyl isomerase [Lentimicrobium sp.]